MGRYDMPVLQLNAEHRVGQGFDDLALHFDGFFLRHSASHSIPVTTGWLDNKSRRGILPKSKAMSPARLLRDALPPIVDINLVRHEVGLVAHLVGFGNPVTEIKVIEIATLRFADQPDDGQRAQAALGQGWLIKGVDRR